MISSIGHYWSQFQEDRQRRRPIIAPGHNPIVIGPWLGEVGPELQYWIPFLQRLKQRGVFGDRRLVIVSRGGVASWYKQVTQEYRDVFSLVDEVEFKKIRLERPTEKQFHWTAGEQNLIKRVANTLKLTVYDTIHPSALWLRILPYFKEQQGLTFLLDQLRLQPIITTDLLKPVGLPDRYVAVRFYQSDLFPSTADNTQFVATLLATLLRQHQVVALVTKHQLDDHAQFPMPQLPGIHTVTIDQSLASNLGLQTEVLTYAEAFFGTYGGLTILPGLLRKPCYGFIGADLGEQQALHFRHEAVTQQLYQSVGQPYLIQTVSSWSKLIELTSIKTVD